MKDISWNSRCFQDLAKFRFLSDITKEQQLDFIAFLETRRSEYTDIELNNICGGKQFPWSWTGPKGHSGGILLGINPTIFDIGSSPKGISILNFV
jgi:hypothetical protein